MSEMAIVPASDAAADAPILYVVFKVAGADYALAASVVLQMESFAGATMVPGAPPHVAGIIQLRGRVVAVVDLRRRFGHTPKEPGPDTRVVVGEHAGRTVALVADSAREVMRLAPSQLKAPPRLVDDGTSGYVKAVAQVGDRTLMILDFAKVIGEEAIDV